MSSKSGFEQSADGGPTDQQLLDRVKAMTAGKDYGVIVLYIDRVVDGRLVKEQTRAVEFTSLLSGRRVFIGECLAEDDSAFVD